MNPRELKKIQITNYYVWKSLLRTGGGKEGS